jgi:hypothetical protein
MHRARGEARRHGARPCRRARLGHSGVRIRRAAGRSAGHGARHDPRGRDRARVDAGGWRSRLRGGARRSAAAAEPEAHHAGRAARHLCVDRRFGHPARHLCAAAGHRGGGAQGGRAARAAALDQCDRGAARPDCVADLGRDGGARGRARRVAPRPRPDPARDHSRDARRCSSGNALGGVPWSRARRRSRLSPAPGGGSAERGGSHASPRGRRSQPRVGRVHDLPRCHPGGRPSSGRSTGSCAPTESRWAAPS